MYNAVWTSWQCLFAYTIEQDVNDEYIYKYPTLYAAGQKGIYFGFKVFWRWIFFSIWHGGIVYTGTVYGLSGPTQESGITNNHWWISSIAFTVIIHIIVIKLFMETHFWNWYSAITGIACLLLYYATVLLLSTQFISNMIQPELYFEYYLILSDAKGVLTIFLLPIVALIPDITFLFVTKLFFPTPTDYVMQLQKN